MLGLARKPSVYSSGQSRSVFGCSPPIHMLAKRASEINTFGAVVHKCRVTAQASAGNQVPSEKCTAAASGIGVRVLASDTNIGLEVLKAGLGLSGLIALYNFGMVDPNKDLVVVVYEPHPGHPHFEPLAVTVRRRWVADQNTAEAVEKYLLALFNLEPGQASVRGVYTIANKKYFQHIAEPPFKTLFVDETVKKGLNKVVTRQATRGRA